MIQLPEIFETRMKALLGAEYDEFAASYEKTPLRGLRLNLLKIKCSDNDKTDGALPRQPHSLFEKSEAKTLIFGEAPPVFNDVNWCKYGLTFPDTIRPSKSIMYAGGVFYIQEPSAMCPVEVLAVQSGDRVLDMCAAPGGKSAQIAGHLQGRGLLVSNDASPSRSRALVKNLERAGVTNAIVLTEQPKKIAERFPAFFDRILVDAPCSGEGMFRRDPDAVKAYTANKPEACVLMQMEILHHAAALLKPGGRLVYSTCTFNPMENERVIAAFLEGHEDFSLVKIDHDALGISSGRADWVQNKQCDLSHTARLWPHLIDGEGHFVACLQKNADGLGNTSSYNNAALPSARRDKRDNARQSQKLPTEFAAFCKAYLPDLDLNHPIAIHGASLYIQPEPLDLKGLRVARSGWYVGDIIRGRFTPSQALAMGISRGDAKFSVDLSEADAWRYLRGESIHSDFDFAEATEKPWVLITHLGFPLGWAKWVQGRLKNQLPTGWVVK